MKILLLKNADFCTGPQPKDDDGAGFDCAPSQEGGVCYEPQYWHFRSAELVVRGQAQGGRCL